MSSSSTSSARRLSSAPDAPPLWTALERIVSTARRVCGGDTATLYRWDAQRWHSVVRVGEETDPLPRPGPPSTDLWRRLLDQPHSVVRLVGADSTLPPGTTPDAPSRAGDPHRLAVRLGPPTDPQGVLVVTGELLGRATTDDELAETLDDLAAVASTLLASAASPLGETSRTPKLEAEAGETAALAFIEWDLRFRVVDWNEAAERIFGYGPEEARTLHGSDFVPADVWPRVQEIWSEQMLESGGYFSRNLNCTRDGRLILCEWYNTPLVDDDGQITGVFSLVKNVTNQEHAAQRLRESKAFAEQLIAVMNDGVTVVDRSHVTIQVNDAFCAMTGFSRDDLLGTTPPYPYWPAEAYDDLRSAFREIVEAAIEEDLELTFRRRDGTHFPVLVSPAVLRDEDGQETAHLLTIKDITDHKRREAELQRAKEDAEEMSRLKSAFLANMSHEIRTPLTAILGSVDIIENEDLETAAGRRQVQRFVRLIQRGGERLLQTLNAVLDLSHLEAGVAHLTPGRVDVIATTRGVVEQYRPDARSAGIALSLQAPDAPLPATLDASALHRILANVLDNALKFSPSGGTVTVRVTDATDAVRVEIADTGIGIDPAFLDRIFEPFEQESTGLRRSHEGVGIGLAVTQHLVRLMNGTIAVDSTPGEGTTVTVHLPSHGKHGSSSRSSR